MELNQDNFSYGEDSKRYILRCSDGVYIVDTNRSGSNSPITVYKRSNSSDSRKSKPDNSNVLKNWKREVGPAKHILEMDFITKVSTSDKLPQKLCELSDTEIETSKEQEIATASKDLETDKNEASRIKNLKTLESLFYRLRYILHQLNRGELLVDDLKKNIEYAALVLETAYMDESRRLCEEDDDLAEVTPEAVPDEVRQWLAATFTRQPASKREKPTFKSVANAIRTGIFFDKMYRKLSGSPVAPIPSRTSAHLKDCCSWDFDIFELNTISENHALKYIGFELFNRYGLLHKFKIPFQVIDNFLSAVENGYNKHNPCYHNSLHGADITQTTHWMLSQTGLLECLSDLEVFAVLVAALIHDFEHTGHTNNFHIQSSSDFALLYNDRSVLENHHVSSSFRLMTNNEYNILASLSKDEYREFRNLVVDVVLGTDMSMHFVQVKTMKNMLTMPEGIDKIKALSLLVHCCDISHPAKPWQLHKRWTSRVLEEFFRQGDMEHKMGLPYSPLCDRDTTHVADSQIGTQVSLEVTRFIDFIVEPTMVVCGEMLMKMIEPLVAIPPTNLRSSPSSSNNALSDHDSSSTTGLTPCVSPFPANGVSVKHLPMTADGKLDIPQPWIRVLRENKLKWKEQSAIEEKERNKRETAKN